jgi:hypothetical protein
MTSHARIGLKIQFETDPSLKWESAPAADPSGVDQRHAGHASGLVL